MITRAAGAHFWAGRRAGPVPHCRTAGPVAVGRGRRDSEPAHCTHAGSGIVGCWYTEPVVFHLLSMIWWGQNCFQA